jgi:hypothetical protein
MIQITLEETARWIGHSRWLEERCFELFGGWVPTTPEPDAKLAFARQSHHHAWHAELFDRVSPAANGFNADGLVGAPNDGWEVLFAKMVGLASTVERVVAAYELLIPHKLREYERWRSVTDEIRDAPLLRWLAFVILDERNDLAEGQALLEDRTDEVPWAFRAPLEAAVTRAGPLLR